MITQIGSQSRTYILDHHYQEYLGFIYEEVIRNSLYSLALQKKIPFMPHETGKWWENIFRNGQWMESEIDVAASDGNHILLGECRYRNRKAGVSEYENLKREADFAVKKTSDVFWLIASDDGFTEDLKNIHDDHLILIEQDQVIRTAV